MVGEPAELSVKKRGSSYGKYSIDGLASRHHDGFYAESKKTGRIQIFAH
jgi:hypothetical protein